MAGMLLSVTSIACAAPLRSSSEVFASLAQTIHERTGHTVTWPRAMNEDAVTHAQMSNLLNGPMSEEDAVAVALLNSNVLHAHYELLALAHGEGIIKITLKNPFVTLLGRFPVLSGAALGEANLLQSLLDVFLLPWRREQAGIELERTRLRVAQAVLDVVRNVRVAYYRLQASTQILQLQGHMLEELRASSELTEIRSKSRSVDDVNLALGRATYQQARLDFTRQEVEVGAAREALLQELGLETSYESWRISCLPDPPTQERSFKGLTNLALQQRLSLAADRALVDLMGQMKDLTQSSAFLGTVLGGGAVSRDTKGTALAGPTLVFELPIFNRRQGEIEALEASLRRAQHAVLQERVKVVSQVRQAERWLLAMRSLIEPYTNLLLPLRHQITELTVRDMTDARQGAWDVVFARQNELHTQCERVKAMHDYWTARANLEHAVGTSLGQL